jgi:hypothetical protein
VPARKRSTAWLTFPCRSESRFGRALQLDRRERAVLHPHGHELRAQQLWPWDRDEQQAALREHHRRARWPVLVLPVGIGRPDDDPLECRGQRRPDGGDAFGALDLARHGIAHGREPRDQLALGVDCDQGRLGLLYLPS